ncbi:ATP-grasp domain-containing protein [Cryptosporangium sp. NPDC051539]|uniref:ATP-grasp domain-containing protein n=1 Tax=Cryptosporangium sp. NPDC051539 TaxID=3363962 RepID=UPI0037B81C86
MTAPLVVVTGAAGPAGRSLCTQLRAYGVRALGVDLVPPPDDPDVLAVPAAGDPALPSVLTELAARHGAALIIPTVSEELPALAPYADTPTPIVVGSVTATALAHDKWWTARALDAAGVPVPHCLVVEGGCTPAKLVDLLGAPFVTKPRAGRGGRGVTVHRPGANWDRPLPDVPRMIAQEFAPGEEYAVDLYRSRDAAGADPVVVLRKTSRTHGEVGNAVTVERADEQDVAEVALCAARALQLYGPADVDVRRRADGTPVVLEVNARFGAHSAAAPEIVRALLAEYLAAVAVPV